MMNPVAHSEAVTPASGSVHKGQGKAEQGSLFAKLMAVFGNKVAADAAKGGDKTAGKGAIAVDAAGVSKGASKHQKGEHAETLLKGVKASGDKANGMKTDGKGGEKSVVAVDKPSSGDGKAIQQVVFAAHQQVQHETSVVAKVAHDQTQTSESVPNKGKQSGNAFHMLHAHEAKAADRLAGQQDAQHTKQAQRGDAVAAKGDASVVIDGDADSDAKAAVRSSGKPQLVAATNADPGKDRVAPDSRATASRQQVGAVRADSEPEITHQSDTNKGDAKGAARQPSAATVPHQSEHAAANVMSGKKAAHTGQTQAVTGRNMGQNGQEAGIADTAKPSAAAAAKGVGNAQVRASAEAAHIRPDFHPSGEAAMQQAVADEAAAGKTRKAQTKAETASHKGKGHDKGVVVTAQAQEAAKPASPAVGPQAQAVPRNMQGALASAAASASATQPHADDAGSGTTGQQVQNNGGNTPFSMHGMDMTSTSSIPRAYMASAQPGAHSGTWTAMMAMQEIGHQASHGGKTRIELKLSPAHLGKIQVFLDSDSSKQIQVHIVVDQAASRQVIEQHLPSLRQTLEQQGLNLGQFSMSSQQQSDADSGGQQQRFTNSILENREAAPIAPSTVQASGIQSTLSGDSRLSIHI